MQVRETVTYRLIADLSGQRQTITIPRLFVKLTGSYEAAAMLGQIVYWREKMDGVFYKSLADWEEELALSPRQVRTAADRLVGLGLVSKVVKKVAGAPTTHWQLNDSLIVEKVQELVTDKSICQKRQIEMSETTNPFVSGDKSSIQEPTAGTYDRNKVDVLAAEVLEHLNKMANRKFRPTTSTLRYIVARLREGFEPPDLKAVIDYKTAAWINSPKMSPYLRPETLFSEKFQSYLQEARATGPEYTRPAALSRVEAPDAAAPVAVGEGIL